MSRLREHLIHSLQSFGGAAKATNPLSWTIQTVIGVQETAPAFIRIFLAMTLWGNPSASYHRFVPLTRIPGGFMTTKDGFVFVDNG